ncbi:hypothetical protein PFISCL1PPCAC_11145, partial [Pristionchus fissidentatus]
KDLFMSNFEFFYLLYPIVFKELNKLVRSVFPEFDEIPDNLKCTILANLIGKFNGLEYYYRSKGKFQRPGICMCSLITVFDYDSPEEFLAVEGLERKEDMMRTLITTASDYMNIFDQIMQTEEISETEFHATIAILICQLDTTLHLPDRIQRLFDETRVRVFAELQVYYREELELKDFSSRLGNVMSLSTAFS